MLAGMTRRTGWIDVKKQRILVAICAHFSDAQGITRSPALHPKLLPRARPEMRYSTALRLSNGICIHMRHHQNILGRILDHNRGDKPGHVELRPELQ